MKKTLKITLLVIVYLLTFSTSVQAYTADFTGTPTSVNSGETFTVKITADEATTLANSHIKYDSSLFTFVEVKQTNLSASIYQSEGEISWMYTDLNANTQGVKSFEFIFKAKSVTKDKTGTFQITDPVFITVGEKTYEGTTVKGDKNIAVTVKAGNGNSGITDTDKKEEDKTPSSSISSKNETTSGNKTNTTSSNKQNTITSSKYNTTSDKTTTEKNELPKTGEGTTKTIILVSGIALIALAVNFKKKAKELF